MLYVVLSALILPAFVTAVWRKDSSIETPKTLPLGIDQLDLVEAKEEIVALPKLDEKLNDFEEYIVGVVSAEMPALFPMEALKAQAVAARTYAVRNMKENDKFPLDIGQAYIDENGRKTRWGEKFLEYENRIRKAVKDTQNEIMTYGDEPILAVFHAQSGGRTETAENVWSSPLPYLKSVDSSEDQNAPDFETETTIDCQKAVDLLKNEENSALTTVNLVDSMNIVSRSDAGYVLEINVGGRAMTGRELRETLGLRSTNFTFKKDGSNIVFTTKGYGHGAGMSQYGAKFMADDGNDYHDILNHYYIDIQFEKSKKNTNTSE